MIADQDERDEALDPARSFIVQAPAGAGKTGLLIQRYIALLPRVEKPEEILAITFTRKAAAEMKKRVLKELPDASALAHRLRIMTIDAFCASLTRQMPVVAKFGAQPEIETEPHALYQEAAERALAALGPAVERLLAHLDNDVARAAGLLAQMLARRDQWLRRTGAAPTRTELEAVLVAERERLLHHARAFFPDASAELAAGLLTKEGEWRKKVARAREFAGNEPARAALAALLKMPPERYSDAQWDALSAILDLLAPALQQLLAVFAERGRVDFTEVAHGALLALGTPEDPTDLLLALDVRIRHILVDEFQDTSASQWQLLERLTAGWEAGDGRTVFAVGDPMQSVYRFRDAEVGLFLHARRAGLPNVPLESLTLSTNFRSQAGIVDWANGFFAQALPVKEDETTGAVPYSPSSPNEAALAGEAASWHVFTDRAAEARRVVDLVRNAGGKAAILVRTRNHLDAIVPALKAAGLRFRAVEIEQLGERQVVQDLYALTRALMHPADRIAWLAILRAPWCGLDLHELHRLCTPLPSPGEGPGVRAGEPAVWEGMQEIPELARICDILRPALEGRLRGTLRDAVESAWLALGGPACVDEATDLEDAEAYLAELERLEEAGTVTELSLLEERLGELYARPDVNAGDDAVEIMTIHKAKGLEFDTVIVPGLDRAPRDGDKPLFAWNAISTPRPTEGRGAKGEGASILLAPIDETGGGEDPIYRYVRDREKESGDIEAGRLFYVAATRAKKRLHLTACVKPDGKGGFRAPSKRSLLALSPDIPAPEAETPSAAPPSAPAAQRLRRLGADFRLPPAPPPVVLALQPDPRTEGEQIEFSWVGETARQVGTVVHRWLQRIAEDELKGWDEQRVASLRPRYARELARRGVPPAELDAATARVALSLANAVIDGRGRWILGPHSGSRTELRLRERTPAGMRTRVIDRLFTAPDGVRWIVDYKTGYQEGSGIEAFLDRERERYRAQLAHYGALVPDARLGIYFPAVRGWREL